MAINYQKKILTSFQETALLALFNTYEELRPFYLTGGTALAAFHLHHRYSDDLDFFTHDEFDAFKLDQVMRDLSTKNGWRIVSSRRETFFYKVLIEENQELPPLKIDFVKDTSPHFGMMEQWGKVPIDTLRNISSNKITAIFGRTEAKDFVDLYFILKDKITMDEIFEEAQQKDGGLNEFYFAGQLRNVELFKTLPNMIKPITLEDLKKTMLNLADQFIQKAKPR